MLFMESGEKRGMFSSIKGTKMWKRNKKIALYLCWPQWGKFHLIYLKTHHNLNYLKIKRMNSLLIQWILKKTRVRCKLTTKRKKNVRCSFFMQTTESKERKFLRFCVDKFMTINEPKVSILCTVFHFCVPNLH